MGYPAADLQQAKLTSPIESAALAELEEQPHAEPSPESRPALPARAQGDPPRPISHAVYRLLKVIACGLVVGIPWLYPPIAVLKLVGLVAWFRIAATPNRGSMRVFSEGLLIGFVSLGVAFHWARESISETTHMTGVLSVVVWCGLVLWEAIPFGLLSLVIYRTAGRWLMFGVPFVWCLFEIYWPRIFPWSVAHVFLEWLPLMQIAQLGGQALITGVILWFIAGLVFLWQRVARGGGVTAVSIATLLPVVFAWGYGQWLLDSGRGVDAQTAGVRIAAVQVDPSQSGAIDRLENLSDSLPEEVDLVCWPESTLGIFSDELQSFADRVEVIRLAKPICKADKLWPGIQCDLLAGAKTYRQDSEGPYLNVAFLINDQKDIVDRYIKRDLMPIGEYVPGEKWFPVLREWAALDDVLDRGKSAETLQISSGTNVGVMICYEDMVADNAIESVRNGAQILVALINASQFPSTYTLMQHERLARLRAVETQRWVVRCGATGRTCLIAPSGELVDSVPLESEGVLLANVKARDELTLYTRYPGWFAGACGLIAIGVLIGGWRRPYSYPGG